MQKDFKNTFFSRWQNEIYQNIEESNCMFLAIFDTNESLLFANKAFKNLLDSKGNINFLNPTFEELIGKAPSNNSFIFDGYINFGTYSSKNASFFANIYRKQDELLIIGGIDAKKLTKQNEALLALNQRISLLQGELIDEKQELNILLESLHRANEELKEINATKDKFFSIIAHDLKNPFNSIIGFAKLLEQNHKTINEQKREDFIKTIGKSATDTYDLLENLLMWSRSQSGRIKYSPQNLDLKFLIVQTIDLLSNSALKKEITIHNITDECDIFADESMLLTIFRNILSNAIKFTPRNGNIFIETEIYKNEIVIEIRDTGAGMSKEETQKLFKIKENFSKKGTENETGTGLGLIICKEFIDYHNGQIKVESELNVGTTFYIELPLIKKVDY